MNNTLILEMINGGEIEKLKEMVQEEIYKDSLKGNTDAKKRYAAMKRYFKYVTQHNPAMEKPCEDVVVNYESYNCFIDGYSIVCTTESIGEMESYDKTKKDYFNIDRMMPYADGEVDEIDFTPILAKAKANGYKFKKSELANNDGFEHLFKYKDAYYKIGILDQAYSIINDGEKAEIRYTNNKAPLFIKTSIGMCVILPINASYDIEEKKHVVSLESVFDK